MLGVSNKTGDSWRFQPKMKEAPSSEGAFLVSFDIGSRSIGLLLASWCICTMLRRLWVRQIYTDFTNSNVPETNRKAANNLR